MQEKNGDDDDDDDDDDDADADADGGDDDDYDDVDVDDYDVDDKGEGATGVLGLVLVFCCDLRLRASCELSANGTRSPRVLPVSIPAPRPGRPPGPSLLSALAGLCGNMTVSHFR